MTPPRPRRVDPVDTHSETEMEEWEDWEDEDLVTPIVDDDDAPLNVADSPTIPRQPSHKQVAASRVSLPRNSIKVKRLKSRQRQRAQNAKAGIKVVTDMTVFRRANHVALQMQAPDRPGAKFVDAAALKALEGEPDTASIGNWGWLRRAKSAKSPQSAAQSPGRQDLSPNDRPIVIGIAMPEEDLANRQISPQTAVVETPVDIARYFQQAGRPAPPPRPQQQSVWSPDTPDTASSWNSNRASSIYSHHSNFVAATGANVPPVPQVPASYKQDQRVVNIQLQNSKLGDEDDDGGSPCTLFEEDGTATSRRKSLGLKPAAPKVAAISPISAGGRSQGWWDTVTTPFSERESPLTARQPSPEAAKEESVPPSWWADADRKAAIPSPSPPTSRTASPALSQQVTPRIAQTTPIVRAPTPRRTPSPRVGLPASPAPLSSRSISDNHHADLEAVEKPKPRAILAALGTPTGSPPPYSPPRTAEERAPVRYRALFPPGHPLQVQYPPSPGPVSPALAGTMTSQGAINMTDIPLTPAPDARAHTPSRLAAQYAPEFPPPPVSAQAARAERRRQRHEKEEAVARRVGGLWKGRGCIPSSGCYGRSGREGRKKRRVKLGIIIAVLLLILIIGLAVGLTRAHASVAAVDSIFLNLTNFPPMPTGVVTIVGPDNSRAVSACTQPSTLWSCALPKEQQDTVAPFNPVQPTFIMQIQFDNSTGQLWNVPDGTPPQPTRNPTTLSSRDGGSAGGSLFSRAAALIKGRQTSRGAFTPIPDPPSFGDMFFLGNTTDGIVSDRKAGEPTPFYLSFLQSVNGTVGPNTLGKRQGTSSRNSTGQSRDLLPPPDLNPDGTGAPAQLLPRPYQQPVRLYDRGLPTEHYGFYTYFKRTIYLKEVVPPSNATTSPVPVDTDGGSKETEANFLVTWAQTRMLVQIWTRMGNTSALLLAGAGGTLRDHAGGGRNVTRPGTMPYPVTVTLDTHGGDPDQKAAWVRTVDARQRVDASKSQLLFNDIGTAGTLVNPRGTGDPSFGGFDGGSGGCRCEWVNFIAKRPQAST